MVAHEVRHGARKIFHQTSFPTVAPFGL